MTVQIQYTKQEKQPALEIYQLQKKKKKNCVNGSDSKKI